MSMSFLNTSCFIQATNVSKMIGNAKVEGGVYILQDFSPLKATHPAHTR